MKFFVGLHQPSDACHFDRAFISVRRLQKRKSKIVANTWIMDSGAYSELDLYGRYVNPPSTYASVIRFHAGPGLIAAVAQDYMCEPHMLAKTKLNIKDHQRLTIERYDVLLSCDVGGVYIIPVLQGYAPQDYVSHIRQYGSRLRYGMWVGVGSVCKRNGDPQAIEDVLLSIHQIRPDLQLHGFGIKTTAFSSPIVRVVLATADSMAWSLAARRSSNPKDANNWRSADKFRQKIDNMLSDYHIHYRYYANANQRQRRLAS